MRVEIIANAIEQVKLVHDRAVQDIEKLTHSFAKYGWHDEEEIEELAQRETYLRGTLNTLHSNLLEAAAANV